MNGDDLADAHSELYQAKKQLTSNSLFGRADSIMPRTFEISAKFPT